MNTHKCNLRKVVKLVPLLLILNFWLSISTVFSQGGAAINTTGALPDASAGLDIQFNNKGLLIPRMTSIERNAIVNPASGLQIYNTTTKCFEFFEYGIWQTLHCAICPMPVPAGAISGNSTVCQGDNIVFYSVPIITNATSYTWLYSGTGATINGTTNTVSVDFSNSATSGNLTVIGTNICGDGVVSANYPITVNLIMPVNISISPSANPICSGTSVTFTATPTNGGTSPSYQWKVNGVNVGTNSDTYVSSSLTNGDQITCELTSNALCASGTPAASNTITMTVNPNLPVSVSIIESLNPICSGTNVSFTASPSNGGTSPSYQWKVNGVNLGTNSNTYINNSLLDGDVVTCELTSNALCASGSPAISNNITMAVNPNLPVSVSIASSANPICSGISVTLTATPTNGGTSPSYQWNVNGANVGTNSNTYINSTFANGDQITCELTSNALCASGTPATSNTITLTVNPNLPVSISISASANPIYAGESVTFTAIPTNGGSLPTYQWEINGSNVGTNSNTFLTNSLLDGDVVTCELTSNATCITGSPATSNTITMTVNAGTGLSIGDTHEGGIIFYLEPGGCSGLVCAPYDQGMSSWGCEGGGTQGTSTSFGTGQANTSAMVNFAIANSSNWMYVNCPGYAAAEMCDGATEGGYTDWFLPSLDELVIMSNNLWPTGLGNLSYGDYWSSSEVYDYESYYVDITTGNYSSTMKGDYKNVRAVRWFNSPPIADPHVVTLTEIVWNWNTGSSSPIAYKYNTTPDYASATNNGTSTTLTQSGLTCGTTYNLYVWADYACGPSSYTVLTAQTVPVPSQPTKGFHDLSLTGIVWNWNTSNGAMGYKYNTTPDYASAIDNGASTSFSQTGLTCNTSYTLYVWAYNGCGVSSYVTLTTKTLCCDAGTDVTFIYSGVSVTYGIVGGQNGTCWLDRNLGAAEVATSATHADAYGDLFQWGRLDDGHQKRSSGTTTTLSATDVPGHNLFIRPSSLPHDWRSSSNNNLWQGVSGTNNPCPSGWRLPNSAEFQAEVDSWNWDQNTQVPPASDAAFASPLKWTVGGWRQYANSSFGHVGYAGHYWGSSIISGSNPAVLYYADYFAMSASQPWRADGRSVRCIKN